MTLSRRFFYCFDSWKSRLYRYSVPQKNYRVTGAQLGSFARFGNAVASYQSAGYQFVRLPSAFDQPQDFQQFVQFDVFRPAETEPFFFHCFFVTVNGGAYRAFAVAGKIRAVPVRV